MPQNISEISCNKTVVSQKKVKTKEQLNKMLEIRSQNNRKKMPSACDLSAQFTEDK